MKYLFNISVTSLKKIHDMPDSWTEKDYRTLLTNLEIDGVANIAKADLEDMALMALQDMEPDEAADAVLAYELRDKISAGARQNIVQDLLGEQKPWEEFADMKLHPKIFAAAVLIQKSFPTKFAKPEMMELVLHVVGLDADAKKLLSKPPEAAFVCRLLADAMQEDSILERLFDEQLVSHNFPDAQGIIWLAKYSNEVLTGDISADLTIYSSEHWLDAMKSISEFQSNAYNDTEIKEKDDG